MHTDGFSTQCATCREYNECPKHNEMRGHFARMHFYAHSTDKTGDLCAIRCALVLWSMCALAGFVDCNQQANKTDSIVGRNCKEGEVAQNKNQYNS